ncbi:hypothetical protein LVJ82_17310 [Vitreoscilla massiliensis]|uniref:Baseplate J-like protein n=1 Tax=Vitreoscilla massiliensis TaxID=1689272 RepID=A0ABY4E1R1_9NEIS|nr:hypothetical protein [Vitreoscilla massiliensis]UOO89179.1 hypothetical protein LVJ82_17310 [Vitreoscilla massiliensis]
MAYTKDELYNEALNELSNVEALAERVQIGDVTITQPIAAIAQMLAMLSMQTDLGLSEYWTRARDSFVLADAAARQILPFGSAKVFKIAVRNDSTAPLTLLAGRRLLDQRSRLWVVREGVIVPAGGTATLTATQYNEYEFTHTVTESKSFYWIAIPEPEANQSLISMQVIKAATGDEFVHTEKFNNIELDSLVYHVMGDEKLNMYIQFGHMGKFGYTPTIGEQITIKTRQSYTNFTIDIGSQFSLEYSGEKEEFLSFFANEELQAGGGAASISELRELVKFPYLYDENAVYLGEFTQLIQRKMRPFVFLAVWNEAVEESVRGANVNNINTLFVSLLKSNTTMALAQAEITKIIQQADDSYKIKFVGAKEVQVSFNVSIWLSPLHDSVAVSQKIKLWVIENFGRNSTWARRGRQRINISDTTDKLKAAVPELSDGKSDVVINVVDPNVNLPEAFRYVSDTSLKITTIGLVLD